MRLSLTGRLFGRVKEGFIHAIRRAKQKYEFHLYALCMMSNHVHYLIEPARQEDLPRIMHWLNWYSAMCFNRMLKRTGHFWEQRYHSSAFPTDDRKRALNTLRYIHANPRVAGITRSFIYRYSNYGIYAKLSDERLTTWHPAFLELGDTLEKCASRYRRCTGEEECCRKPRADHGHIAKRERVSLLSVQSGSGTGGAKTARDRPDER